MFRFFQTFLAVFPTLSDFPAFSDVTKHVQVVHNIFRVFQTFSDFLNIFRCSQQFPAFLNASSFFLICSGVSQRFQMFPNMFRCFPTCSDVPNIFTVLFFPNSFRFYQPTFPFWTKNLTLGPVDLFGQKNRHHVFIILGLWLSRI